MAKVRRALTVSVGVSFALIALSPAAFAATAVQVTNFGPNPTGIGMYLYTPSNVVAKPPILVGIHACHGKGLDVCSSGNPFAQQADKYGFLLVCPSAISSDGCWDVHSMADLSHNGSGDAAGIISMVNYVVQNKNGDATRVYAAGHSSGGMMTNVLLGSYPDVFKAGAAFAGVAFACFAQGSVDNLGWSSTCANGNVTMTGAQWGALVRAADPSFTGTRPRIQVWHGTVDETVNFHNFGEEIKEWTNVLGVNATPTTTENNAIQSTWIRTRYANSAGVVEVEAIQETGQPHNLVIDGADAIHFLGLDGSTPGTIAGGMDAGGSPGAGGAGSSGAGGRNAGGAGGAPVGNGAGGAPASAGGSPTTAAGGASNGASSGGASGTNTTATGGALDTSGGAATGGSSSAPVGSSASGGSSATAAASGGSSATAPGSGNTASGDSSSGCALSAGTSKRSSSGGFALLLGLTLVGWRRRRAVRRLTRG